MHNNLLDVSLKALQKDLEKEARRQNRDEFGVLDVKVARKPVPSTSLLKRLLNWLGDGKLNQPVAASPKLKNKIV